MPVILVSWFTMLCIVFTNDNELFTISDFQVLFKPNANYDGGFIGLSILKK